MKLCQMLLAAAAGLAVAACAKVENLGQDQEINFAVGAYAQQTKASSIITADGVTSFMSKAFLHKEGAAAGTDYFGATGTAISWDSGIWSPARPYYWPKHADSYINFVSWYDKNGSPTTATESSLVWSERTIAADDNIMYADEAWRYKANVTTYQMDGASVTGVPTLFHHALAKVKFQIRATPLVDSADATVTFELSTTDVTLTNVHKAGTMSLSNSDPSATQTNAWVPTTNNFLWTATDTASDIALTAGDLGTSYVTILEQSVMPQSLPDEVVLNITYTMVTKQTKNGTTTTLSSESNIPAAIKMNALKNTSNVAIAQWLPNKIYTYSITINPASDQILIDPDVESDWTIENTSVTIE